MTQTAGRLPLLLATLPTHTWRTSTPQRLTPAPGQHPPRLPSLRCGSALCGTRLHSAGTAPCSVPHVPCVLCVSLRRYGDLRGIYIGAGVPEEANLLNQTTPGPSIDPLYAPLLAEQYSLITAADFYFGEVEPSPGVFNFVPAEKTISFAEAHNQTVRCHNLIW